MAYDSQWVYSDGISWEIHVEGGNTAPTTARVDPASEITIEANRSVQFQAALNDSDGNLAGAEWYVEGSYADSTPLSGTTDTANLTRTFPSTGTYTVTALGYDSEWNYSDGVSWDVRVEHARNRTANTTGLYVWNNARGVVTSRQRAATLWETVDRYNVSTLYLSFAGARSHPDELSAFIQSAHERNITVQALIGPPTLDDAEGLARDVAAYNNQSNRSFDGIQFDVEPHHLNDSEHDAFYERYGDLLTRVDRNQSEQPLSVALGSWILPNQSVARSNVIEHPATDTVVALAYRDTGPETKTATTQLMNGSDTPYVVASETKELAVDNVTHYAEGPNALAQTQTQVAELTDTDLRYQGTAIHYFGSLQTWNAIETLDSTTSEETVSIDVELLVLEDELSSHEFGVCADLVATNSSCDADTQISLQSGDRQRVTLDVPVPNDLSSGEQTIEVRLTDSEYSPAGQTGPVQVDSRLITVTL